MKSLPFRCNISLIQVSVTMVKVISYHPLVPLKWQVLLWCVSVPSHCLLILQLTCHRGLCHTDSLNSLCFTTDISVYEYVVCLTLIVFSFIFESGIFDFPICSHSFVWLTLICGVDKGRMKKRLMWRKTTWVNWDHNYSHTIQTPCLHIVRHSPRNFLRCNWETPLAEEVITLLFTHYRNNTTLFSLLIPFPTPVSVNTGTEPHTQA